MFEGMFNHEFRFLRAVYGDATPEGQHKRCLQTADDFWNPKLLVNKKGEATDQDNVQQGSVQIIKAIGLLPRFPADFKRATDALFTYRNQALHNGYEWPREKRANFKRLIDERRWGDWFSWATISQRGATELWIAYMNDNLIRDCFNIASDSVVAFESVRKEQFERLPRHRQNGLPTSRDNC